MPCNNAPDGDTDRSQEKTRHFSAGKVPSRGGRFPDPASRVPRARWRISSETFIADAMLPKAMFVFPSMKNIARFRSSLSTRSPDLRRRRRKLPGKNLPEQHLRTALFHAPDSTRPRAETTVAHVSSRPLALRPPVSRVFQTSWRPWICSSARSFSAWKRRPSECRSRCGRPAWGATGKRARSRRSSKSTRPAARRRSGPEPVPR